MRGWIILIGTLLVGAALGVAGTVYVPPRVDPYLPKELRLKARVVEGQVVQKQRESNRVLVKIQTDQGVILAAFTKRVAHRARQAAEVTLRRRAPPSPAGRAPARSGAPAPH